MSDKTGKKRTIYSPPPPATVEKLARAVCEKFGYADDTPEGREVVSGLTDFLILATKIQAKYLTKISESEHKLDSKAD